MLCEDLMGLADSGISLLNSYLELGISDTCSGCHAKL